MSPLSSNLPSIISPSLINIAVVAKSFVILALSNLDEIATKAYDDTPDAHPGLAKDQTLAHLLSHEKQGRLSNDGSGGWHASID